MKKEQNNNEYESPKMQIFEVEWQDILCNSVEFPQIGDGETDEYE